MDITNCDYKPELVFPSFMIGVVVPLLSNTLFQELYFFNSVHLYFLILAFTAFSIAS